MHAGEVVPHVVQVDRMNVVLDLLGKRIGQPGEPTHRHTHREVLPLDIAGADVSRIGIADHFDALGAKTLRRAVAFLRFGVVSENLHQLRVVHVGPEGMGNGVQVHLVAVRGQLHAIRKASLNIPKEIRCIPGVPPSSKPANCQLGIRIKSNKRPNIASIAAILEMLRLYVLGLGSHEAPNLIDLDALRGDIAERGILIFGARGPNISEQPENRPLCHARHAGRGIDGATLDQRRDDRRFLVDAEYVCHELGIPYRSGMSTGKRRKARLFTGFLLAPSLLGRKPSHLAPLVRGQQRHAVFAASLATFTAHSGHDLGNQAHAYGDRFRLPYGLQDHAAGILSDIKPSIRAFVFSACTSWHMPSVARIGTWRQEARFSNCTTTIAIWKFPHEDILPHRGP
jgi:hypothetical protein